LQKNRAQFYVIHSFIYSLWEFR